MSRDGKHVALIKHMAVFLALCAFSAGQTTDQDVRSAIEKRYQELARVTERRDLATFMTFRHETFHVIGPDGRVLGPADMQAYSEQFFATKLSAITVRFTIRGLQVSPDGMVAVVEAFF